MTELVRATSQSTFAEDVVSAERPVLVDFYADWCAPCKVVQPIVEQVSAEFGDRLDVVKVDVDQNKALAAQFGIRGIPTLMLFKNGEPVETIVGVATKDSLSNTIFTHL